MTKILGLTGGIGSGKTSVAKMFTAMGVPVYNADYEAKVLMQSSEKVKSKIIELFGEKAYLKNGLNRSYIAQNVFKDKEKLNALNAIVHPEVAAHFNTWMSLQSHPYVVKEVAILFEIDAQNQFDFILTAHHADDNLETFLINLTRGSGLDGFTGIPKINGNIARPLLPFSREEILAYASNNLWRDS